MTTSVRSSLYEFSKEDNSVDFLFAPCTTKLFRIWMSTQRKELAPLGAEEQILSFKKTFNLEDN